MRPLLGRRKANPQIAFLLLLAGALLLSSCDKTPKQVQVSEQPEEISQLQDVKTEPREGRFSLRSRIAYSDIKTLIESEIPATYQVQDSRRLCKRIIGIKACGTANWNLNVIRDGELTVRGNKQRVNIRAPISFDGIIGMQGQVAKVLGLSELDVLGSVVADISLGLDINESWCPRVSVSKQLGTNCKSPSLGPLAGY